MTQRPEAELDPSYLAGRLEGLSFVDLLWGLCCSGQTGVLTVAHDRLKKVLYIRDGQPIFASSEHADDKLGALLLNHGRITALQLEEAMADPADGRRLGQRLIESGTLHRDDLAQCVTQQIRSIILNMFPLTSGEYRFVAGPLPTDEPVTLRTKSSALLFEGIQKIRSLERMRDAVGDAGTRLELSHDWELALDGLILGEGGHLLIEQLRQATRTIEELCEAVILSDFETYQRLWCFQLLGVTRRVEPYPDADSVVGDDFVAQLVRLARARETGVLVVEQGRQVRTFHIRNGQCIFATSNDHDDGLIAYLLRTGMISLRDRDETIHRRLTNKRTGTILLEMGVIDDRDLQGMVRRQLTEIVCDTIGWDEAQCRFTPGSLPSSEDILLDRSVEALVAGGIRRVTSWSRVRQGCGGMQAMLSLTPSYLDVLDAIAADVEEWDVVSLLKAPQTVSEVCQESQLNDFRSCQILWTLRALGGVETIDPSTRLPFQESKAIAVPEVADRGHLAQDSVSSDAPDSSPGIPAEARPAEAIPEIARSANPSPASPAEAGSADASPPWVHPLEASYNTQGSQWSEALDASSIQPEFDESIELSDSPQAAPVSDDASPFDANPLDANPLDANPLDANPLDANPLDANPLDANPLDANNEDQQAASAALSRSIWEMERSTRTVRLSREEVQHALEQHDATPETNPEHAPERDSELAPQPAQDRDGVEPIIRRFNAVQQAIFQLLKAEIGAGAANFIRATCQDEHGMPRLIDGVSMGADGVWDEALLRDKAQQYGLSDPWPEYRETLSRQIDGLRELLGHDRVEAFRRSLGERSIFSP